MNNRGKWSVKRAGRGQMVNIESENRENDDEAHMNDSSRASCELCMQCKDAREG